MSLIKTNVGWKQLEAVCVNSNQLEGVFAPMSAAASQLINGAVADEYAKAVYEYVNGRLPKERIFVAFSTPRFGAYGDRL